MPASRAALARILGYSLVLGAIAGLALFATFVARELLAPDRVIQVRFPEIATLAEGDAVVENGVEVGTVRRIRLAPAPAREPGEGALVELELHHRRPLARDARFVNFSHSLMGARKVWIAPGASPEPLDESAVQPGTFAPGLAETLHKVDSLTRRVAALRAETERLLAGDHPALAPLEAQRRLEATARAFDALSARLGAAQASLRDGLGRFQEFTRDIEGAARAGEPRLDSAWRRAEGLFDALSRVEDNLDSVLARAEALAAFANDSAGAARLLHDDALHERLRGSVRLLEQTAKLLRKGGLGDSVKIRPRLRG